METPSSLWEFSALDIHGKNQPLSAHEGKVVLIVNVASQCGFTPQYKGLQALQDSYGSRGLVVLGFPCNQFGGQEPGSEAEIAQFCERNFSVKFPLYGKIEVNGEGAHPLYVWLKSASPGILGTEAIKWNFTKFLVGRDGKTVKRFAPQTTPEALGAEIEALL